MTIGKRHVVLVCLVALALIAALPLASCKGPAGGAGGEGAGAGQAQGQGQGQGQNPGQEQGQSSQASGAGFGGYDPGRNNSGEGGSQNPICVDGSFGGSGDGTPQSPYRTIQEAVDAAANGDTIKVASGTYAEAVQISQKKVQLLGGFAGGGDFATADRQANNTVIEGAGAAPCIYVYIDAEIPGPLTISGFTILGGRRGIELSGGWSGNLGDITIENNIIEGNGTQDTERGGGIGLEGNNVTVQNNILRDNKAGRGAAIGVTDDLADFIIADNRIEDNTGYDDHAGGMSISGTGTIARNYFSGNVAAVSYDYGWGGAALIYGDDDTETSVAMSYNVYQNNSAPSRGGAVFVDDGATVRMEHELFYSNASGESGSAVYVDADWQNNPSVLYMNNCTVSGNPPGSALFVQASDVYVENCIFWNNGSDFEIADGGSLAVDYTLTGQGYAGTGNVSTDPLFADVPGGDFHVQSRNGHFDPSSGAFVADAADSPAIDAGNPSSDFSQEPTPNGGRVNLGCYGNTAQSSKSAG